MPLAIPQSVDEITPRWLEMALGAVHRAALPAARIAAVEPLDRHDGTTGRARLGLRYAAGDGPASIFVKLPPADPAQRAMVQAVGMGRREARFYAEIAADVPARVPRPLYAASEESGAQYIMLLEDLVAADCSFPKPRDPEVLRHAERVVEGLAAVHARFWESPRFERDLHWVETPMRHEIGSVLVARALERFGEEMSPGFRDIARLYIDHVERVCDRWEEGERTLIHGDCHMGNLFVDRDCIGFLDWAVLSRSPGVRDVSYFLCNSIPTELRRGEERALLGRYRDALLAAGAPAVDFDTLWQRHRRLAVYSWVAAATTAAMGDKWQPLQVGLDSLHRTTRACEDLDSVGLLRSEIAS